VLLACNNDDSDMLPTHVTGKYTSFCCWQNVKIFPTKYDGSTNSCITTTILEDYITQIDGKVGAKKC
jgi:hypothetical protein